MKTLFRKMLTLALLMLCAAAGAQPAAEKSITKENRELSVLKQKLEAQQQRYGKLLDEICSEIIALEKEISEIVPRRP